MLESDIKGTNIVEYVAPYKLEGSPTRRVLSTLKPVSASQYSMPFENNYTIPVFNTKHIFELIDINSNKISNSKKQFEAAFQSLPVDQEGTGRENISELDGQDLNNFVEIEDFYPKTHHEQITTLAIDRFPGVRKVVIERILKIIISDTEFQWTKVDSDIVEQSMIFLRIPSLKGLKYFLEYTSKEIRDLFMNDKTQVIVDSSLESYLNKVQYGPSQQLSNVKIGIIKSEIQQYLKSPKSLEKFNSKRSDDLDEVFNYYSNYKIDENELVDTPIYLRESIKRDIVRFRARVLTIEINNRKEEIESERINTKQKLKEIFEGIKEANDGMVVERNSYKTFDKSNKEKHNENISDEDYEKLLLKEEKEKLEQNYEIKLALVSSKEKNERKRLLEQEHSLKNYETNLMDNKLRCFEEIKNFNEFDDAYHLDHSEYIKARSSARIREIEQDRFDRSQEEEEINKTREESVQISLKAEPILRDLKSEIDFKSQPETVLQQIKIKVSELIEEYLGIQDEFLSSLIFEFLKREGLNAKSNLIEELSQPLDEDAVTLVNDLWNFVHDLKLS